MTGKKTIWDVLDARWPIIYDEIEHGADDVNLIHRLIGDRGPLRILEPFCGTGRILIPLAQNGHEIVGLDKSRFMLDRARKKVAQLPEDIQQRIKLIEVDVTAGDWPQGFDVVILGGNWPYELPSPEVQEGCIVSAAASLKTGGYIFHDSDHMEGELDPRWREPGVKKGQEEILPDGSRVQGASETIWYDATKRLWQSRRSTKITFPDGSTDSREIVIQKHPPSRDEVRGWLEKHGFNIEWSNETEGRITYWAKKK